MELSQALRRLVRSPAGTAAWAAPLAAGMAVGAAGLLPYGVSLPLGVLAAGALLLLLALSPVGGRAVAAETKREQAARDLAALARVEDARRRLSLVRIRDASVRSALGRLLLASGRYLESAARFGGRDPLCEDAVLESAEALDDYLRLSDAASAARSFAGRAPGGESAGDDDARRAIAFLDAASERLEERLALASGGFVDGGPRGDGSGVSAGDRVLAREELR